MCNTFSLNNTVSTVCAIYSTLHVSLVLGPLLSLSYINDLPLNIQDAKMVLFADDINILIIDKNIDTKQERLNRAMKQFETWFSNNSLIINTDKTKAMLFHFNKTCNLVKPKIVFNTVEIIHPK